MCGRYTQIMTWEQIHKLSEAIVPASSLPQRYNLAPTQASAIVRLDKDGNRQGRMLKWGLLPSWTKDKSVASSLINARAETIELKPSYKAAFRSRRCLLPMNGYYEWVKTVGSDQKQAFYISQQNSEPIFVAGIWERWHSDGVEQIETFSIITTESNSYLRQLHERMPVLIRSEDFEVWLNPASQLKDLKHLLKPADDSILGCYPVSDLVNNPANDMQACIERA
jgi:putative SOS response-associated peptidase YedK